MGEWYPSPRTQRIDLHERQAIIPCHIDTAEIDKRVTDAIHFIWGTGECAVKRVVFESFDEEEALAVEAEVASGSLVKSDGNVRC
jgi:hypothetical protein